jgi:cysteine-rich repeat protein
MALLCISVVISACGDDGSTPADTGTMDAAGDGGMDDGGFDCLGIPDGTSCAEGFICRSGLCSPSECGDGFLDMSQEACDDGNEIPGDGCEPNCEPTCSVDADCDDGDPCNGAETCNMAASRCQAGASGDGMMCTRDDGEMGVCASGLCAPPGCGNGTVDGMEDCDDGMNGDNTDGCRDDCSYTCTMDAECSDGDVCTGDETCDTTSHTCQDVTDLDCDDGDPCTGDSCEAETGCANTLMDGDGDGYAPDTLTCTGAMGGDCDDSSSSVYPGAAELCDGIDNDCNGMVDDGTVTVTCLRDSDGDGYGNPGASVEECTCPSGYIPPRADGRTDCQDGIFDVNEGQTSWFATPYCPPRTFCMGTTGYTYDYNCDGTQTQRWTSTGRSGCLSFDCRDGWTGSSVPACGATAQFRDCDTVILPSGLFDCVERSVANRRQECR